MAEIKIHLDVAEALLYQDESAGYKVVENRQIGSRRWVSEHELVIQTLDGNLYRAHYEQGLTECQERDEPFGYGVKEVPFKQVMRESVTHYEYKDVA
jgi:hypothetical protein